MKKNAADKKKGKRTLAIILALALVISGLNNTQDKIFLLSIAEACNPAYGFNSEFRTKSETRVGANPSRSMQPKPHTDKRKMRLLSTPQRSRMKIPAQRSLQRAQIRGMDHYHCMICLK